MKRILKITGALLATLIAITAIALVVLSTVNLNRAKPWLEEKVATATGRSFALNGDLSLSWERPGQESGWRRVVPWPHLRAEDVMLGNPDWASTGPEMARIARIDFNINPFKLLTKTVSVHSLIMTEPRLALEQDAQGRKNWDFPKSESKSNWNFEIKSIAMAQGTLRYVDAAKHADLTARVDTEPDNSMRWQVKGTFNDEPFSGDARSGALLSLQEKGVAYPIEARAVIGETTITAKGTLTDPANPSALDVRLSILGASMADLFPLGGVLLPRTPKFSTEGRVVGTLGRDKLRLRYEDFKGKVGGSDIGGTLEYIQQKPRPVLRGEVVSQRLVWKDLGALVGAGDTPKKQKSSEVKQPPDKVLPVSPFNTARWGKMDADVKFRGQQIIHSERLPVDNLDTHVKMDNGVLALAPLNFGVAGGRITTELKIDGSDSPAKATMQVSARGIKLKQLFPKIEAMRASLGQINGDARLSAVGNSFAALAAASNGELKALVSEGTVSEFVMEAMGLNVGRVVVNKLFGDHQVKLNCLATDISIKDGLMQPQLFVLDTEDAIVEVDGNISLAKETLDLDIRPRSKGLRLFSLRSPLYVEGTFKDPDVGVNKTAIALRAGAAVALGTIAAPLAGLAALTHTGPDQDSPCASLLAQARKAPVAPPAGQRSKQGSSHEKAVP
ncbi:MAG: AsmA family protein [Noviherbaspirillum sp.]